MRGLALEGCCRDRSRRSRPSGATGDLQLHRPGGGGTGIPSSIDHAAAAVLRRRHPPHRAGKNRKPPLYPRPATTAGASSASRAPE